MSTDNMLFALGPCWACGTTFSFDPETVKSVIIDPVTNRPPDVGADGQPIQPAPEAVERSTQQPICPACVQKMTAARAAHGRASW